MTNPNINEFEPPIEQRVDDLLTLSTVVNQFIDVKRATMRNGQLETDGEHTLHLQTLAVAYAAQYYSELDSGKISLYALVHDFVEVYAGDVNSLGASEEQLAVKALKERQSYERLRRELGEAWPWLIELIEQYESLEEQEARFVKCFDKCDPGFSHLNNAGEALAKMGVTSRIEYYRRSESVRGRLSKFTDEFPDVLAVRDELQRRVGETAFSTV